MKMDKNNICIKKINLLLFLIIFFIFSLFVLYQKVNDTTILKSSRAAASSICKIPIGYRFWFEVGIPRCVRSDGLSLNRPCRGIDTNYSKTECVGLDPVCKYQKDYLYWSSQKNLCLKSNGIENNCTLSDTSYSKNKCFGLDPKITPTLKITPTKNVSPTSKIFMTYLEQYLYEGYKKFYIYIFNLADLWAVNTYINSGLQSMKLTAKDVNIIIHFSCDLYKDVGGDMKDGRKIIWYSFVKGGYPELDCNNNKPKNIPYPIPSDEYPKIPMFIPLPNRQNGNM